MGGRADRLARALVVNRKHIGIGIAGAAGAVALVLFLVLRGGATAPPPPREAVAGDTSLSRSGALFADPLRATIEVQVDRARIDPARIGFSPAFAPYDRIGVPLVSRRDAGRLTRLVYTANLVCLTDACLPPGATKRENLGMCRRIVRADRLVVPAGDDPPVDDHDRSHRNFADRLRSLGFGERRGHPFWGVGQRRVEMVARASRVR